MLMKKINSVILVIVWMIFIFVMSSFNSDISSSQSDIAVNFISNLFQIDSVNNISFIIRKLAHFIEYFILGLLVFNMIKFYNKRWICAIVICMLYAISDEIHQIFVLGRSCQITDILIDSLGAVIGVYLLKYKNGKKRI